MAGPGDVDGRIAGEVVDALIDEDQAGGMQAQKGCSTRTGAIA